ncbi:crossover junction endodeoxyribonuclease RuvC [Candidatus Chlorohelix sp.]|uniref:crossover junction endodeoxyribonuclease RuvC n=1 Tax=Candidatus Chlorohelix sp. TaxID=3139201 RepID=UPI00302A7F63
MSKPYKDENLVLGIDPGSALMGWGLVLLRPDDSLELVNYGAISTSPRLPMPQRLQQIYRQLTGLLETAFPSELAIEELFFNKNTTTVIAVGQARGVALLAAANHDIDVFEYTPLQVKQALVGYGRAQKDQVQEMVRVLLNLEYIPKPDDAADALAIAICHIRSRRFMSRLEAQNG